MKNTSNKIKLKVEDPVVKKVIEKFAERCDFGMKNTVDLCIKKGS